MKKIVYMLTFAALALSPFQAFAGDTNETIDKGAFEIDPSFSINNLQKDEYGKPTVESDITVGYGVLDSFSIYAGLNYGTNDGLNGGYLSADLGLLWTPLDTDNIDIDVMLNFNMDLGTGYMLTPGFEFNYDLEPDLAFLGFYLRFGLPIYGAGMGVGSEGEESKADVGISLTLGAYLTLAEIHQIILEGGFNAMNLAKNVTEDARLEGGFLSLGYNVQLTETFELTTELSFHFKHEDDENFWAGLAFGGIFGIPNAQ